MNVKGDGGPTRLVVTAARNDAGMLEVVVWKVGDDGAPEVVSSTVEGAVSEVGIVSCRKQLVVVGMRDSGGGLRVISYQMAASGSALSRKDTATGDPIRDFAIHSANDGQVTVAARLADGTVQLLTWRVSAGGDFDNPTVLSRGKALSVALSGAAIFCMAARTETGTLRLRAFPGPDFPAGTGTGNKVRSVSLTGGGSDGRWFVGTISTEDAAVRTGFKGLSGRLILDTGTLTMEQWDFKDDNPLSSDLIRTAAGTLEGMAGIAWEFKLLDFGSPVVLSATSGRDTYETTLEKNRGKPKMRVIAWKLDGVRMERVAQANSSGTHELIALARLHKPAPITTNSARLLTAARDGKGRLKVEVWDLND